MKMAADTQLIAKHTISSPNKNRVSMCGIFTYHFKNIDGKNVMVRMLVNISFVPRDLRQNSGKKTSKKHISIPSTIHFIQKIKTYPSSHHPPPSIRVCQESVFIYTLEAPYTQGPTSLLVNIGVSWIDWLGCRVRRWQYWCLQKGRLNFSREF